MYWRCPSDTCFGTLWTNQTPTIVFRAEPRGYHSHESEANSIIFAAFPLVFCIILLSSCFALTGFRQLTGFLRSKSKSSGRRDQGTRSGMNEQQLVMVIVVVPIAVLIALAKVAPVVASVGVSVVALAVVVVVVVAAAADVDIDTDTVAVGGACLLSWLLPFSPSAMDTSRLPAASSCYLLNLYLDYICLTLQEKYKYIVAYKNGTT